MTHLHHEHYHTQDRQLNTPISDITKAHSMGTSIMAVEFNGGVVVGADSRTTTGSYIANRVSNKLTPVAKRIYCCRSGSAADTQAISDYVSYYLSMHTMELDHLPKVKTAGTLFRKLCYGNRNHLMAGIICAGYDDELGGQVYNIPLGGALVRCPFTIGGSGSSYIYGFCDKYFKENMTEKECKEFVVQALSLAMARDGSSGGIVRLAAITKEGVSHETFTLDHSEKKLPNQHVDGN
uniref:Proteasome subunit beta n=1 Tax=Percolomonas cosmopolitus TaxID=63605 RepID=A0A7S1KMG1_9EUKA|mmetsp:Transcript_1655/g.5762  ORF Transcript_1655/g.5762 Transcript_1655/m.5762 type:complete len:237 (+) Transcript_1655:113-823(+)|eukprot:CAMPEP_0117443850 /NCGR_PEP_ID=MMETSP0759-20121206/4923_1 /TAXON_ID=63605 /ORGANISM="Percolomonas cosmopolitus, Strain WS" /LENGTH=236 /DNA_ID=CAMNT_0005235869 /DNA_START=238 /DNA_END=948 /DNA_ORIENTATION=-